MTQPTDHRIEPRQEYVSAAPRDSIRVRVVAEAAGRVDVVDARTGRRPRSVLAASFHASATRRTGYRLVTNADGTPA